LRLVRRRLIVVLSSKVFSRFSTEMLLIRITFILVAHFRGLKPESVFMLTYYHG
jgi:hypothetical protein